MFGTNKLKSAVLVAATIMTISVAAKAGEWEIDASHSEVEFKVRHMMISNVKGSFDSFSGKAIVDEKNIENSSVSAEIDAASIDTGVDARDKHLRSEDFFEVKKFPKLTFKSTSVKKIDDETLKVTGDLTIRDITKSVTLNVEASNKTIKDFNGNRRRGATATTKINRRDFGLHWNKAIEAGGVVVGDEVKITLEVELVEKK